jgi:glycosyltransferase involved in cell wall biosynthesis
MSLQLSHRALYASFDRFPSPKGAATHIAQFATTMFDVMQGGLLYVLADETLPVYQHEGTVEIVRYHREQENLLDRALGFGRRLEMLLDMQESSLELCHFRDPWSGMPIMNRPRRYATIYEVNALPSIELPYSYPQISPSTLEKIRAAEVYCWSNADAIVTPSQTIADNLAMLGAPVDRITVIPNGAEPVGQIPGPPADAPARYILYFGALQRWQGVDVLLRAFARLADLDDLHLVICSSSHHRQAKIYRKLAEHLGVAERVRWHYGLHKRELAGWIAGARMTVAPLVECSRNLEQGCSPLKVLESMAFGVPVVASDLPAVREIITDRLDGRLVRADRPAELARAIRVLLEYPEQLRTMGTNARARIERDLTWEQANSRLTEVYRRLLPTSTHDQSDRTIDHISKEHFL